MRKKITAFVFATALLAALAVPLFGSATAFAGSPTRACNGLDVAHDQIHLSGTQAEETLHVLRNHSHNHCSS